jgi:hypothetical protein
MILLKNNKKMSGKLKSVLFILFMGLMIVLNIKFNNISNPKNRVIDWLLFLILVLFFYLGREKITLYLKNLKTPKRVFFCIILLSCYLVLKYLCYSFYYSIFIPFNLGWVFNGDLIIFYLASYFYIFKFGEKTAS